MYSVYLRTDSPVCRGDETARHQTGVGAVSSGLCVGGELSDRERPDRKTLLDADGNGLSDWQLPDGGEYSPAPEGISRGCCLAVLGDWPLSTPANHARHPDGRPCSSRP